MTTIKSYTDLKQSKKLAEILPLESADMVYYKYANKPHKDDLDSPIVFKNNNKWYWIDIYDKTHCGKDDILAWSLAALLCVLNKSAYFINSEAGIVELSSIKATKWSVSILNCGKIEDCYADNPVDACVAMIEKLHELNLL